MALIEFVGIIRIIIDTSHQNPRYMDLQIWLDITGFDSLSLRTCTCVKPVKNEPMAPLSLIFSWLRAYGIRKKSALRSAWSTIAAELRTPTRRGACASSPAVFSKNVRQRD